jgi:hypothetical protein
MKYLRLQMKYLWLNRFKVIVCRAPPFASVCLDHYSRIISLDNRERGTTMYREIGARRSEGVPAKPLRQEETAGKPNRGLPGGGEAMKKRLDKKTLEKEALFWSKRKNVLDRDEVKGCRK